MLLPALSSARNKARDISCVSNLRQLGLGVIMYANAYNDFIPPYYRESDGVRWQGLILEYVVSGKGGNAWYSQRIAGDPNSVVPVSNVYLCPSQAQTARTFAFVSGNNYSINWNISNPWALVDSAGVRRWQTVTKIQRPSKRFCLGDINGVDGAKLYDKSQIPWRHGNRKTTHMEYVDGHVGSVGYAAMSAWPALPDIAYGWGMFSAN